MNTVAEQQTSQSGTRSPAMDSIFPVARINVPMPKGAAVPPPAPSDSSKGSAAPNAR
ncbi:hypothetical protein [Nitrospirillum bahiense]|uniref:Uncharacterized protein n=1 Tax=Nitrospirillum amazonense TaxID=28077 RepID=A0A560FY03_9PROT|nr:hypothetical protein [Nitrospirillum amazonense]TWB26451.1 hypothetical protein FBZ88_108216 [Nitrospirillum amazonense]